MQIFSITRDGLERVADGVAVVQNSAQPALALVLRDDLGFDLATAGDDVRRALGVELQQPRQRALEPAEQRRVVNDPVLDHLGEPGSQLALGQRLERVEVAQHKARLIKRADQVFAGLQVHADLAADRAVHLGQQRRRHLHEADAAQIARREKAGHVAHHAAAQRHDE